MPGGDGGPRRPSTCPTRGRLYPPGEPVRGGRRRRPPANRRRRPAPPRRGRHPDAGRWGTGPRNPTAVARRTPPTPTTPPPSGSDRDRARNDRTPNQSLVGGVPIGPV